MKMANDRMYEGSYENGVKKGFGKMIYKKGEYYSGDWVNDKRDGYGSYYFADGKKYHG